MDASRKKKPKHPPRPRAEEFDLDALHDRTMKRFPKIMARLGE
ncbi:MAG TPA: hypothetical protein VEW26_13210 [Allosphingosinicella sp.]|nr:hypothetical protein [Allosphingosinicella sp.]